MKNRPLLIIVLTNVVMFGIAFHVVGGFRGIRDDPLIALGILGVLILITVPMSWWNYRKLKRKPIVVEVESPAPNAPPDPRLGKVPFVLTASRPKIAVALVLSLLIFAMLWLLTRGQIGACRTAADAIIDGYCVMIFAVHGAGLIKPERLEFSAQGLRHESFWRSREWRWNEIGDVRVIQGVIPTAFFNRSASDDTAAGPPQVGLRPIWPIRIHDVAALISNARAQWSSTPAEKFDRQPTGLLRHLMTAGMLAVLGVLMWLIFFHPCSL